MSTWYTFPGKLSYRNTIASFVDNRIWDFPREVGGIGRRSRRSQWRCDLCDSNCRRFHTLLENWVFTERIEEEIAPRTYMVGSFSPRYVCGRRMLTEQMLTEDDVQWTKLTLEALVPHIPEIFKIVSVSVVGGGGRSCMWYPCSTHTWISQMRSMFLQMFLLMRHA